MVRVGFTIIGGRSWTGGRNYLLNLLSAISSFERNRISTIVFAGTDVSSEELADFRRIPGVEVVTSRNWNVARNTRQTVKALVFGRDNAVHRQLREWRIDVFFESARYLGWRPGVATIGWIPDLQHRLMPHFFTRRLWLKRELGLQIMVRSKRMVMVSSESARNDLGRFYPDALEFTRVVRFAVPNAAAADRLSARAVANSYGLPEQYFFLPNQFWRHKNHLLVLDAVEILRSRGRPVVVVTTGAGHDPRAPLYFEGVMQRIRRKPLSEDIRYLGMVPYEHLTPLMVASVALLNPSLFEGWSTTVEEARAAGVPLILSDLAVHHEQAGKSALYFDPRDAESLANVLDNFIPVRDADRRRLAAVGADDAARRHQEFAENFAGLCGEAVAMRHRAGQRVRTK